MIVTKEDFYQKITLHDGSYPSHKTLCLEVMDDTGEFSELVYREYFKINPFIGFLITYYLSKFYLNILIRLLVMRRNKNYKRDLYLKELLEKRTKKLEQLEGKLCQ